MKNLHRKIIGVAAIMALWSLGFYLVLVAVGFNGENITLTTGLDDLSSAMFVIMFPFIVGIALIDFLFLKKNKGSL